MFSSPKSTTRGGIPVTSITGAATIATPLATPNLIDRLLLDFGLRKQPNIELTVEQQQALARLDTLQQKLSERETKAKAIAAKKLTINRNDKCLVEAHELGNIKLQRAQLVTYATSIMRQRQTIESRRIDGEMLGILGRGNAEIKRETQRIQTEVDASTISDDLDELLTEGLEDQIGIHSALAGVSLNTDDILSSVQVSDSGNPDGVGSIGDIVARDLDELRSQVAANAEQSSLELREQMPAIHTLPSLIRTAQQQSSAPPLSGGRQAFPASAMLVNPSYASSPSMVSNTLPSSSSAARTSPYSQSQTHAFSAEDDWLA